MPIPCQYLLLNIIAAHNLVKERQSNYTMSTWQDSSIYRMANIHGILVCAMRQTSGSHNITDHSDFLDPSP